MVPVLPSLLAISSLSVQFLEVDIPYITPRIKSYILPSDDPKLELYMWVALTFSSPTLPIHWQKDSIANLMLALRVAINPEI